MTPRDSIRVRTVAVSSAPSVEHLVKPAALPGPGAAQGRRAGFLQTGEMIHRGPGLAKFCQGADGRAGKGRRVVRQIDAVAKPSQFGEE